MSLGSRVTLRPGNARANVIRSNLRSYNPCERGASIGRKEKGQDRLRRTDGRTGRGKNP